MRIPACLLALLGLLSPVPAHATATPGTPDTPLVLAARVWGLAKYHHPDITRCAVDWDLALLDSWRALEQADPAAPDAAISTLLQRAGSLDRRPLDVSTPSWIEAAVVLPLERREQLAWLAAQRPDSQCYVSEQPGTRIPHFVSDRGHAVDLPDRPHRALAALRYWNAIEYFFPYREDIGRDWSEVLAQHLPLILDAEPGRPFVDAMRRFTAEIRDSHAGMLHPFSAGDQGSGAIPTAVRQVEGRPVVMFPLQGAEGIAPGDELLAIDGEPIVDRLQRLDDLGYGSNPTWRDYQNLRFALRGLPNPAEVSLRRPDGSEYGISVPRAFGFPIPPQPPLWERRDLDGGCRIGVIDMGRLQPAMVDAMLADLADTDALLFDVRNYPQGAVFPIIHRLFERPLPVARFTFADQRHPGQFASVEEVLGGTRPNGYRGRLLLLQDELSISHSEYTLMLLQADGRATSFGSQTAAADGNITQIELPGQITAVFTGLGVFYPDGRPTQRIGIVPDVQVTRTRAGLAAGRDEVMDAALDCRWINELPERRVPAQGIYHDPARDGEGIDIHHDEAGNLVALRYGHDDAGEPEWLMSTGRQQQEAWQTGFSRFRPDTSSEPLAGYRLDFHAGPYAPVCAISDQSRLHPRGRWQSPMKDGSGDICVVALLNDPREGASGIWWTLEDGWGVSLHQRGDFVAAVVYAYDAAGAPRWLFGTANWDGGDALQFDLARIRPPCRDCSTTGPRSDPAGSLSLDLRGLAAGRPEQNRLSIDAQFGPGGRWQRENAPFFLLTRGHPQAE